MAEERGKGTSPEEEIEKYLKILGKDPNSRAFAPLAEAYRKAGMLDDAIEIARDGLNSHPSYLGGMVALGRALFEKGQFAEARDEFSKVVSAAPDNLMAHKLLGKTHLQLKNAAEAEKSFRTVLLLDPRDGEARKHLDEIGAGAAAAPPPSAPLFQEQAFEEASPAADSAPTPGAAEEPPPQEAAGEPAEEPAEISAEPIFDLEEMENRTWDEEKESPGTLLESEGDSPFEVYTKDPAAAPPEEEEEPSLPGPEEPDEFEEDIPFFDIAEDFAVPGPEGLDTVEAPAGTEGPAAAGAESAAAAETGEEPVFDIPAGMEGAEAPAEPDRPDAVEAVPAGEDEVPVYDFSAALEGADELPAAPEAGAVEQPASAAEEKVPLYDFSAEVEEGGGIAAADDGVGSFGEVAEEEAVYDLSAAMGEEAEPPAEVRETPPVVNHSAEMRTDPSGRGGPEPPSDVFNTETLADLYIKQGFYGKAADVYRRLLRSRSGDGGLRQKLEEVLALEKMQGGAPSPAAPPVGEAATPAAGESSTVAQLQELLNKLKERAQ